VPFVAEGDGGADEDEDLKVFIGDDGRSVREAEMGKEEGEYCVRGVRGDEDDVRVGRCCRFEFIDGKEDGEERLKATSVWGEPFLDADVGSGGCVRLRARPLRV